jgi:transcription initiation factor IIF auxiliary subunit
MKGTVATRALYYGNIATPILGKKANDSDHTHKWTVLVRGVNNEDISFWIKKVSFRLHETYPNPQRSKYRIVFHYLFDDLASLIGCLIPLSQRSNSRLLK